MRRSDETPLPQALGVYWSSIDFNALLAMSGSYAYLMQDDGAGPRLHVINRRWSQH